MALVQSLIEELDAGVSSDATFNPEDFPQDVELEHNQSVEWVCSTYKEPSMIYVLRIVDGKSSPQFLAVYTSDGGALSMWIGPEQTLAAIKKRVGKAPEGWT